MTFARVLQVQNILNTVRRITTAYNRANPFGNNLGHHLRHEGEKASEGGPISGNIGEEKRWEVISTTS